jgi:D-3-phosphoglycerate dehydrogenase
VKIVITDWGFPSLDTERELFNRHGIELEAHQCKLENEVADVVREADVVMTQWAPVKAKAVEAMTRCRGIVRYGIGLDNVDLAAAQVRGIPVRNVPDYCLHEVADHTMALLLALQRQISHVQSLVRAGTWKITPPQAFPPLRQCTLGLIGYGRIARLVAERAKPFGVSVAAYDPFVRGEVFETDSVTQVDLSTLFAASDMISLHLPLTEETKHLINATMLGRMKHHVLIVNTSRGGLIATDDLVAALKAGRIAGAALDVLEQEPIPPDHPLLSMPNVIVTSHTAWYSNASVGELQRRAALAALEMLGVQATSEQ